MKNRVLHPDFGEGTIIETRRGGRVLVVQFDNQTFPEQVRASSILTFQNSDRSEKKKEKKRKVENLSPEKTDEKDAEDRALIIEALRLGVVPAKEPGAYTVGREKELALVENDLEQVEQHGGSVRTFLGDYGTGKTHLLELIRHKLREKGYLVASAVLSSEEVPPSHPKRVYRNLMGSLLYPDLVGETGHGLEPLLRKAAQLYDVLENFAVDEQEYYFEEKRHLYLTPALVYTRALQNSQNETPEQIQKEEAAFEHMLAWINGEPIGKTASVQKSIKEAFPRQKNGRIFSLMDFRPWSRIYGYLLSGISRLAVACGYKGLAILIDEAEFYNLLSAENRDFATLFFKALAFASMGSVGNELLPFSEDELNAGGHGRLQKLPARFHDQANLYTVFAMTPSEDGVKALAGAVPASQIAELTQLKREDYNVLVERVVDFYIGAWPNANIPRKVIRPMQKIAGNMLNTGRLENPRQAMKFIIEILDIVRHEPSLVLETFEEIRQFLRGSS